MFVNQFKCNFVRRNSQYFDGKHTLHHIHMKSTSYNRVDRNREKIRVTQFVMQTHACMWVCIHYGLGGGEEFRVEYWAKSYGRNYRYKVVKRGTHS
jgi:hypothetical protein